MQRTLRFALIALGIAVLGVLGAWQLYGGREPAAKFRTVPLQRVDLVASIGATGTVEPEEVVDVGAQVAGQINVFGKDVNGQPVDYGSVVEVGTVLAQIDDLLFEAGTDKTKILSATIYLPDMNDFAAMNAVWEKWVAAGTAPARADPASSRSAGWTGARRRPRQGALAARMKM